MVILYMVLKLNMVNYVLNASSNIKLVGSHYRTPSSSNDVDFVTTMSTKNIVNTFKKFCLFILS